MTDDKSRGSIWQTAFLVISGLLSGLLGFMGFSILDTQAKHQSELSRLVIDFAVLERDQAATGNRVDAVSGRSKERHAEQEREIDRFRARLAEFEARELKRSR